jgi:tripartite-type tricarboxylate transporter receptor subunit TctC
MLTRRHFSGGLAALGACGLAAPLAARAAYPAKTVNMVCGFAAGSATDIVARVVSQKLSERMGVPFIVQNITGAASTIALEQVVRAPADGSTLTTISSAATIAPAVYKLKFDLERDLVAIGAIGSLPTALMVNDQMPVRDFAEFVAYAKKNPHKLNYGSSGTGGSTHMAAALLCQTFGLDMTHVPYRGNGPAEQALMQGDIQVLMDTALLAARSVQTKKVRALAITGQARSSALPEVPTFAELGYPKFEASVLFGIMGPKGIPRPVVEQVNRELNEVLKDPVVQEQLVKKGGLQLSAGTPEQFARTIASDVAKWKQLAVAMGLHAN